MTNFSQPAGSRSSVGSVEFNFSNDACNFGIKQSREALQQRLRYLDNVGGPGGIVILGEDSEQFFQLRGLIARQPTGLSRDDQNRDSTLGIFKVHGITVFHIKPDVTVVAISQDEIIVLVTGTHECKGNGCGLTAYPKRHFRDPFLK